MHVNFLPSTHLMKCDELNKFANDCVLDDYLYNQYNLEKGKGTFGKPTFFDNVKEEYWACKEHVCLIDMSSFTKTEVKVRSTCSLSSE